MGGLKRASIENCTFGYLSFFVLFISLQVHDSYGFTAGNPTTSILSVDGVAQNFHIPRFRASPTVNYLPLSLFPFLPPPEAPSFCIQTPQS